MSPAYESIEGRVCPTGAVATTNLGSRQPFSTAGRRPQRGAASLSAGGGNRLCPRTKAAQRGPPCRTQLLEPPFDPRLDEVEDVHPSLARDPCPRGEKLGSPVRDRVEYDRDAEEGPEARGEGLKRDRLFLESALAQAKARTHGRQA